MKRTLMMMLMAASAASGCANALAEAPKSDASAELDRLPFPTGDLTCTGELMAMAGKPGHATSGSARVEKILGGNWIAIRYDEAATADNAKPYSVVQYIGYEDAGKRFISTLVDNNLGSGYSTGVSAGLKDNSITFDEIPAGAKAVIYRDTFTASGETFRHSGAMLGKDKKWVKTDEEMCRKR